MDVGRIKETFKIHYKRYDVSDTMIIAKYYHSIRVMDISRIIAKHVGFNDNDAEIAAIVGLLHDYARFEQWTKYKTYGDLKSIDHGDLAVSMLFDNNEIIKYTDKHENYDEIYDAIKYHNKFSIPEGLTEHNNLLCKIIRDADKLDLFYLFSINKNVMPEDNNPISEKIRDDFFKSMCIDRRDVQNDNDNIVLGLALVFDLNFKYCFEYLIERNLIWRIYENINDKERFQEYFEYIDDYIHERVGK
ncbi:MAG: HD domain-containing protein [Firmicutes bacterium]|nr:HD domain-containing protein [Bacillota bacterium]